MKEPIRLEESVEFSENPEPRCACVLLLDTSGSMSGAPIDALNSALWTFKKDLTKDSLASRRVEIAVITFDSSVRVVQDFVTPERIDLPLLTAQGNTHMGAAIHKALDLMQARKEQYRANGIAYYRPWVFMITDGEPQGESNNIVTEAAKRIADDESAKRVAFFAVGVEGANMDRLKNIAVRTPVKLIGLNFRDLFLWLSSSMSGIAHSRTDEQIALPPPGWGTV